MTAGDVQLQRDAFDGELRDMSIIPLRLTKGAAAQTEPKVAAVPHIRRRSDIKPMMLRGRDMIAPQEAEPGGSTLPTIWAWIQLLRRGEQTRAYRHTSSTVYHVAEGSGGSLIGDGEFLGEEGDAVVVPSRAEHEHWSTGGEAVLFSYPDRPVLSAFGLFHEAEGRRRG